MKYFKDIKEEDKLIIKGMCEIIEKGTCFIVANEKRWKFLSRESNMYTYDYTYNLCRFGFARKARNSDFHAALHRYCPNQDISSTLANFLNTAVSMGLYERTTTKKFDGGTDYQIIWM